MRSLANRLCCELYLSGCTRLTDSSDALTKLERSFPSGDFTVLYPQFEGRLFLGLPNPVTDFAETCTWCEWLSSRKLFIVC